MLLAIDIGNTQIVMGVFRDEEMLHSWRITTTPYRTADECWTQVMAFCQSVDLDRKKLTECAVSSVVPAMTESFVRMGHDRMTLEKPLFIFRPEEFPHIINEYNNPRAVGADRICNAVAGYQDFGGPLIIVDFGTATTFDVIGKDGEYKGGVIAPGLESSTAELYRRAAKLMKVDLKFPKTVIGKSTKHSMQAGIMYGSQEMIDGIVRRIWEEMGGECKVIATGGIASVLAPESSTISETVPFLVLMGLNKIYRKMNP